MEKKLKHLEFIQNVITRMNSNSFLIKGWAITLTSALFALAAKDSNLNYVLVTYIVIPTFWGLDALYLGQERCYRALYSKVSKLDENSIDFSMDASMYNIGKNTWSTCFFSKTILPLYLTIIVITFIIMFIFKCPCVRA